MHDDIRRVLGSVAADLWGAPPKKTPAAPESAPAAVSAPPLERLWVSADETVDWTEVLAHDEPTDGLTSPESWTLYRRYAHQVLSGDPESYLAVLKAADPLKDLTPWAEKFDVACVDANTLRVAFSALPALTEREGRRYIAGMALRIARDLFALLPVLQVEITALCGDKQLMRLPCERAELQKVRFGFIDPVEFAMQCGAEFSE